MQVSVTGMAWYRAEDYDRLKRMFKDGAKLPDQFSGWLKLAQGTYDKLTGQGHVVVKAVIDHEAFPDWCRAKGMEMDAEARMAFGSECAAKTIQSQRVL